MRFEDRGVPRKQCKQRAKGLPACGIGYYRRDERHRTFDYLRVTFFLNDGNTQVIDESLSGAPPPESPIVQP